jgi:hypothetical protein
MEAIIRIHSYIDVAKEDDRDNPDDCVNFQQLKEYHETRM